MRLSRQDSAFDIEVIGAPAALGVPYVRGERETCNISDCAFRIADL